VNIIITEEQYRNLKKLLEAPVGLQVLTDDGKKETYDWLESAEGVLYDYPEYYNTYKDEFSWPIPAVKLQNVDKLENTFNKSKKGICYNNHDKCYKKALVYGKSANKNEIQFKQYDFIWDKNTQEGKFVDSGIKMIPEVEIIGYKDGGNRITNNIKSIAKKLKQRGVTDPKIAAAILAVCSKESGFYLGTEQTHTGTMNQLRSWFPPLKNMTDQEIENLRMNERKFYNKVYGKQTDTGKNLGNIFKNDGYNYRGRGWNGITGRAIYKAVGYENNPWALETNDGATNALINYYDKVSNILNKTYPDDTAMSTIVMDFIKATGGFSPTAMTPFILSNYQRAYQFLLNNFIKNGKLVIPEYSEITVTP